MWYWWWFAATTFWENVNVCRPCCYQAAVFHHGSDYSGSPTHFLLDILGSWGTWLGSDLSNWALIVRGYFGPVDKSSTFMRFLEDPREGVVFTNQHFCQTGVRSCWRRGACNASGAIKFNWFTTTIMPAGNEKSWQGMIKKSWPLWGEMQ